MNVKLVLGTILAVIVVAMIIFLYESDILKISPSKETLSPYVFKIPSLESLIVIDQNQEEEGWTDLEFNIIKEIKNSDNNYTLYVCGQKNNKVVGFKVELNFDKSKSKGSSIMFFPESIKFSSLGEISDTFIQTLSDLYNIKSSANQFTNQEICTSVSLKGNPLNFPKENLNLKCFFNEDNEELYSELFVNIDLDKKILQLKEKDTEYREEIIKSLEKK